MTTERAYRRALLLTLAQRTFGGFTDRMAELWQQYGRRTQIDGITELMMGVERVTPKTMRNSTGSVIIGSLLERMDDNTRLRMAGQNAATLYPELPPHQAFRKSLAEADRVYNEIEQWIGPLQEAADALFAASGDELAVRAPVMRHVARGGADRETRDRRLAEGLLVCHAMLRPWAFPEGEDWVEAWIAPVPQVSGSAALDAWQREDDIGTPQWLKDEDEAARQAVIHGRRRRWPRDPNCTCGYH